MRRMAVHVKASVVPSKLQLLQEWVPEQPWLDGSDASVLTVVGSYRFDDPDGEVGIETHLLGTADSRVLQVPLTYRGAPRPNAEASLITTMTHTVLGDRWIYDACYDPVYVRALVTTILTGGAQAELFLKTDAGLVPQPVNTYVRGSGTAGCPVPGLQDFVVTHDGATTRMHDELTVTLLRTSGAVRPSDGESTLTGTWPGQQTPLLLATVR
jgi:hypothetical protein